MLSRQTKRAGIMFKAPQQKAPLRGPTSRRGQRLAEGFAKRDQSRDCLPGVRINRHRFRAEYNGNGNDAIKKTTRYFSRDPSFADGWYVILLLLLLIKMEESTCSGHRGQKRPLESGPFPSP